MGNNPFNGNLKVGVWNNYLVKKSRHSGPPVQVEYLEFEAPYLPQWPPQSHRDIFIDSSANKTSEAYAREVISSFAQRAFRRSLRVGELDGDRELVADSSFGLAQAMALSGRKHAVRSLAQRARAIYAEMGDTKNGAQVESWLKGR